MHELWCGLLQGEQQNPATSGAPTSGASTNAQGQPDYSAAWAMYYQQLYQQQAAAAGQPGANAAQGRKTSVFKTTTTRDNSSKMQQ